jgi:hypothetical protein
VAIACWERCDRDIRQNAIFSHVWVGRLTIFSFWHAFFIVFTYVTRPLGREMGKYLFFPPFTTSSHILPPFAISSDLITTDTTKLQTASCRQTP